MGWCEACTDLAKELVGRAQEAAVRRRQSRKSAAIRWREVRRWDQSLARSSRKYAAARRTIDDALVPALDLDAPAWVVVYVESLYKELRQYPPVDLVGPTTA